MLGKAEQGEEQVNTDWDKTPKLEGLWLERCYKPE